MRFCFLEASAMCCSFASISASDAWPVDGEVKRYACWGLRAVAIILKACACQVSGLHGFTRGYIGRYGGGKPLRHSRRRNSLRHRRLVYTKEVQNAIFECAEVACKRFK